MGEGKTYHGAPVLDLLPVRIQNTRHEAHPASLDLVERRRVGVEAARRDDRARDVGVLVEDGKLPPPEGDIRRALRVGNHCVAVLGRTEVRGSSRSEAGVREDAWPAEPGAAAPDADEGDDREIEERAGVLREALEVVPECLQCLTCEHLFIRAGPLRDEVRDVVEKGAQGLQNDVVRLVLHDQVPEGGHGCKVSESGLAIGGGRARYVLRPIGLESGLEISQSSVIHAIEPVVFHPNPGQPCLANPSEPTRDENLLQSFHDSYDG